MTIIITADSCIEINECCSKPDIIEKEIPTYKKPKGRLVPMKNKLRMQKVTYCKNCITLLGYERVTRIV